MWIKRLGLYTGLALTDVLGDLRPKSFQYAETLLPRRPGTCMSKSVSLCHYEAHVISSSVQKRYQTFAAGKHTPGGVAKGT